MRFRYDSNTLDGVALMSLLHNGVNVAEFLVQTDNPVAMHPSLFDILHLIAGDEDIGMLDHRKIPDIWKKIRLLD